MVGLKALSGNKRVRSHGNQPSPILSHPTFTTVFTLLSHLKSSHTATRATNLLRALGGPLNHCHRTSKINQVMKCYNRTYSYTYNLNLLILGIKPMLIQNISLCTSGEFEKQNNLSFCDTNEQTIQLCFSLLLITKGKVSYNKITLNSLTQTESKYHNK